MASPLPGPPALPGGRGRTSDALRPLDDAIAVDATRVRRIVAAWCHSHTAIPNAWLFDGGGTVVDESDALSRRLGHRTGIGVCLRTRTLVLHNGTFTHVNGRSPAGEGAHLLRFPVADPSGLETLAIEWRFQPRDQQYHYQEEYRFGPRPARGLLETLYPLLFHVPLPEVEVRAIRTCAGDGDADGDEDAIAVAGRDPHPLIMSVGKTLAYQRAARLAPDGPALRFLPSTRPLDQRATLLRFLDRSVETGPVTFVAVRCGDDGDGDPAAVTFVTLQRGVTNGWNGVRFTAPVRAEEDQGVRRKRQRPLTRRDMETLLGNTFRNGRPFHGTPGLGLAGCTQGLAINTDDCGPSSPDGIRWMLGVLFDAFVPVPPGGTPPPHTDRCGAAFWAARLATDLGATARLPALDTPPCLPNDLPDAVWSQRGCLTLVGGNQCVPLEALGGSAPEGGQRLGSRCIVKWDLCCVRALSPVTFHQRMVSLEVERGVCVYVFVYNLPTGARYREAILHHCASGNHAAQLVDYRDLSDHWHHDGWLLVRVCDRPSQFTGVSLAIGW